MKTFLRSITLVAMSLLTVALPAQTTQNFYAGSGSGITFVTRTTFSAAHDAATADSAQSSFNGGQLAAQITSNPGTVSIYRSHLVWDTGGIPDNATITGASLVLYVGYKYSAWAGWNMEVVQSFQSSTSALRTTDYANVGTVSAGNYSIQFGSYPTYGYIEIPLNATGVNWVSKTGYTKLALRSHFDRLNWPPDHDGLYSCYFMAPDAAYPPFLRITYTTPGGAQPSFNSPEPGYTIQRDLQYLPAERGFSWDPIPGASFYVFRVVYSPTGQEILRQTLTSTGSVVSFGASQKNGAYQARLTALVAGVQTSEAVLNFAVASPPPAPSPQSPPNTSTIGPNRYLGIYWSNPAYPWGDPSDAIAFQFDIARDSAFTQMVKTEFWTDGLIAGKQVDFGSPLAAGRYYWRLRCRNNVHPDYSAYSSCGGSPCYFTVSSSATPPPSPTPTSTPQPTATPTVTPTPVITPPPTQTQNPPPSVNGPSCPSAVGNDPVNFSTGNFLYTHTDVSISSRGFGFQFTRTYNAIGREDGPLGWGWRHSYAIHATELVGGAVEILWGDGHLEAYDPDGSGGYTPRYQGLQGDLQKSGALFAFTTKTKMRYEFNDQGDLARILDRNDNTLTLNYETGNLGGKVLQSITDTAARQFTFAYHPGTERIESIEDPIGRKTLFDYEDGDLTSITSPRNGEHYVFTYDADHRIHTLTDKRGILWLTNTYDAQDRVTYQTLANGAFYNTVYDDATRTTTVTGPTSDTVSVYHHDLAHRFQDGLDPLGNRTDINYDVNNRPVSEIDPLGYQNRYVNDDRGNRLTTTDAYDVTTNQTIYENDLPKVVTDAHGRKTQFIHDARGNLTTIVQPDGATSQWGYDTLGQLKVTTDSLGQATHYDYDTWGNRNYVRLPNGQETHYTFDVAGRMTSSRDHLNRTSTYHPDPADNVTSTTGPAPLFFNTEATFDANRNRTGSKNARGYWTRYFFDDHDNMTSTTNALNETTQYLYDESDHLVDVVDPAGNRHRTVYNSAGQVVATINPLDQATTFTYDANGNRIAETNANGHTWRTVYDRKNRATTTLDPLGNGPVTRYDSSGRVYETRDPMGNKTAFTYDDAGRLKTVTDPENNVTENVYNARGDLICVRDPKGAYRFSNYDGNGRLTAQGDGHTTTTFTYDAVGQIHTVAFPSGVVRTNTNDELGRLTHIDYSDTTPDVTFQYDPNGDWRKTTAVGLTGQTVLEFDELDRIKKTTDPFGFEIDYQYWSTGQIKKIVYPGTDKWAFYEYDPAGRLKKVTAWFGDVVEYVYDPAGNLIETDYANGAKESRAYDKAERLNGIAHQDATGKVFWKNDIRLDANGNHINHDKTESLDRTLTREHSTYTYDDATHQAESVTDDFGLDSTFAFDDNGNLQQIDEAGNVTTFTHDAENRLTNIASPGFNADYTYDGEGRRIAAERNGVATHYILDLNAGLERVLCEANGADTIETYYIYGLGLTARVDASTGDVVYYHGDHLGSTVAITDASASVVKSYTYDEFGAVQGESGTLEQPFQFVGQLGVMKETSRFYFMRARYHDATTGRFLQPDPAKQFASPYLYGHPNPLSYRDPSGRWVLGIGVESEFTRNRTSYATGIFLVADGKGNRGRYLALSGSQNMIEIARLFERSASTAVKVFMSWEPTIFDLKEQPGINSSITASFGDLIDPELLGVSPVLELSAQYDPYPFLSGFSGKIGAKFGISFDPIKDILSVDYSMGLGVENQFLGMSRVDDWTSGWRQAEANLFSGKGWAFRAFDYVVDREFREAGEMLDYSRFRRNSALCGGK